MKDLCVGNVGDDRESRGYREGVPLMRHEYIGGMYTGREK